MNRQDGPLLVGGTDDSTRVARPLLIDHATGALITTGSGGGGGNVTIVSPIGQGVMADSVSVVIASDQTPVNTIANETASVYAGTTPLTPKFAKIAASSSGDNTIVAAVTAKKIRVLAYNFISNGSVNAKWQSGASGTDLTGLKYCIANMGLSAAYCPVGWFESASGVLLNLNLSAGVAVGGELVYVEV